MIWVWPESGPVAFIESAAAEPAVNQRVKDVDPGAGSHCEGVGLMLIHHKLPSFWTLATCLLMYLFFITLLIGLSAWSAVSYLYYCTIAERDCAV